MCVCIRCIRSFIKLTYVIWIRQSKSGCLYGVEAGNLKAAPSTRLDTSAVSNQFQIPIRFLKSYWSLLTRGSKELGSDASQHSTNRVYVLTNKKHAWADREAALSLSPLYILCYHRKVQSTLQEHLLSSVSPFGEIPQRAIQRNGSQWTSDPVSQTIMTYFCFTKLFQL